MRRENKRHHQHRSAGEQFDMFRLPCRNGADQRPAWEALPPQTRTALLELMTRLLLDHAQDGHSFERMVAEVCLGKVGAVAAREVSRFARNSRDWQQLIEMCRVVDTVLVDQETVYAPRQGNDRLLLGLKGSLNDYALRRE